MNARAGWFEVNRAGLARVAGRRVVIHDPSDQEAQP